MQRLHHELQTAAANHTGEQRTKIRTIANAVVQGEFDGTKQEADTWFASPQGQVAHAEFGWVADKLAQLIHEMTRDTKKGGNPL